MSEIHVLDELIKELDESTHLANQTSFTAAAPIHKGIRLIELFSRIDFSKLDLDKIQKLIDTLTPLIPTYGPIIRLSLTAILDLLKARKAELQSTGA